MPKQVVELVILQSVQPFSIPLICRITTTEAPTKGLDRDNLINTNVFELNVVLMDSLQCGLTVNSSSPVSGCSRFGTPESSVPNSPQPHFHRRLGIRQSLSPRPTPNLVPYHEFCRSRSSSPLPVHPDCRIHLSPVPIRIPLKGKFNRC